MKAEQARKIWFEVVDELMAPNFYNINMNSIIKKLKRVKFTHDGEMKRNCHHSSCGGHFCEHFYYVVNKFPSLVKEWNRRKELAKIQEDIDIAKNKL